MFSRFTTYFFIVLFIYASPAGAQQSKHERIHAAKMAYVTDRIHLSSEQAGTFTPLYNEYEKEIRDTRQRFFGKYKEARPGEADEVACRRFVDDNLDYQQQVIEIKRKYNDRFLKVISSQQLADLYQAEREFRQMLMKRLEQKRSGRGRGNN